VGAGSATDALARVVVDRKVRLEERLRSNVQTGACLSILKARSGRILWRLAVKSETKVKGNVAAQVENVADKETVLRGEEHRLHGV
jgi:hypothetical protein